MNRSARWVLASALLTMGCGTEPAAPVKTKAKSGGSQASRPPRPLPAPDPKGIPPKYTRATPLAGICYSPDGRSIAVGCLRLLDAPPQGVYNGKLRLWDFRQGTQTDLPFPPDFDTQSMDFTADGSRLVTINRPVDAKSLARSFNEPPAKQHLYVVNVATKTVESDEVWNGPDPAVAYSATTLVATRDADVQFWDPVKKTIRSSIPSPFKGRGRGRSCLFMISGDRSTIGVYYPIETDRSKSDDVFNKSAWVFFRSADLQVIAWMPGWSETEPWLMAPDGKTVYRADTPDWTTAVWDVTTPQYKGTVLKRLPPKSGRPSALSYDGSILVTRAETMFRLFRMPEGKPLGDLAADLVNESRNESAVVFAPDGKSLAVIGNRRIQVWDLTALGK